MSLTDTDAYARLRDAARRIDPTLLVDRAAVHWIDAPYPGVSFGLSLGPAHALLFMPSADIDHPGWEPRLAARLASAHGYLAGFTHTVR